MDDLIYTNANKVDQGVLTAYTFDLSFGASENDFEMKLGGDEAAIEYGAFVYLEGTEYGGIVDGKKTSTTDETITYTGRTWHGMLNSKILEPDAGADYLIVSGPAQEVLSQLIRRMGLSGLFVADAGEGEIAIRNYKFARYCAAYDGLRAMLAAHGAKLKLQWLDYAVHLSAEPIEDYTDDPEDGDTADLKVEQHANKVNHLICLGRGDLAAREVIHLYTDAAGNVGDTQYYFGIDENADVYDNSSAESSDALRSGGVSRLKELRGNDKAEMSLAEDNARVYDIGDIVGASEIRTGVSVAAAVTQKIVRINNGTIDIEYKTGG